MNDIVDRLRDRAYCGKSVDELLEEAAAEIVRLGGVAFQLRTKLAASRITDAEREAISEVVDCLTESGTALANPTTTRNTLAALLERMK